MCHFWAQTGLFVINKILMVQTIIITFIYLLALFIVQNLKKILTANPEVRGYIIFGPQMVHLLQFFFFFFEKNYIIFIYLLAPFILRNFKKILKANPNLWGCAIFGPKIPQFVLNKIFSTNHYYYFHLPIGPFHWAKFKKKKFLQQIQSYEDAPFLDPK